LLAIGRIMNHEQIIARFSTFIYLRDAQDGKRSILVQQANPTLRNLAIVLVNDNPYATENDWARYFLGGLIDAPRTYQFFLKNKGNLSSILAALLLTTLSYQFMFSYLQLICFYSARQISDRFQSSGNLKAYYSLEDCFGIACEAALNPSKLLKHFNFNANFPIHGYARKAIDNFLQNRIVKDLKTNALKFSDNGLLKQLNATQLEKALKEYGLSEKERIRYRLAWQAYRDSLNELYAPTSSDGKRKNNLLATAFNERQLNLIAERYNFLRSRLENELKTVNGEDIQKLLTACIQVVRSSQNKKFVSIEDRSDLTDLTSNSLDELIDKEANEELEQLKNIIIQEFEALDELAKKCLLLWLGLGISQTDFLFLFNFSKQYQVARQFQRYQKKILINAIRYYYDRHLAKSLTEKEVDLICSDRLDLLKDYLTRYSYSLFASILELIIKDNFNKKTILSFDITNIIYPKFSQSIETKLKILLKQFTSSQQNINNFISKWLQQNQAILY
jgi:hypothetical protein